MNEIKVRVGGELNPQKIFPKKLYFVPTHIEEVSERDSIEKSIHSTNKVKKVATFPFSYAVSEENNLLPFFCAIA